MKLPKVTRRKVLQFLGLAPAAVIAPKSLSAEESEEYSSSIFVDDDCQLVTVLKLDYRITDEQREKLIAEWSKAFTGFKNKPKVVILEPGINVNRVYVENRDEKNLLVLQ